VSPYYFECTFENYQLKRVKGKAMVVYIVQHDGKIPILRITLSCFATIFHLISFTILCVFVVLYYNSKPIHSCGVEMHL